MQRRHFLTLFFGFGSIDDVPYAQTVGDRGAARIRFFAELAAAFYRLYCTLVAQVTTFGNVDASFTLVFVRIGQNVKMTPKRNVAGSALYHIVGLITCSGYDLAD